MKQHPVNTSKSELRAAMRARVASLTSAQRREASNAVCLRLVQLPQLTQVRALMTFMPLADELDVTTATQRWLDQSKTVAVPVANWQTREMEAVQAMSLDASQWQSDQMGVRTPIGGRIIPVSQLHGVIVPGLAFDERGYRLGRNAGFYDRFLARVSTNVLTVGVCLEAQIVDNLPVEPHDLPVDVIVTERRVIDAAAIRLRSNG